LQLLVEGAHRALLRKTSGEVLGDFICGAILVELLEGASLP